MKKKKVKGAVVVKAAPRHEKEYKLELDLSATKAEELLDLIADDALEGRIPDYKTRDISNYLESLREYLDVMKERKSPEEMLSTIILDALTFIKTTIYGSEEATIPFQVIVQLEMLKEGLE